MDEFAEDFPAYKEKVDAILADAQKDPDFDFDDFLFVLAEYIEDVIDENRPPEA